jgi:hypothetical protein
VSEIPLASLNPSPLQIESSDAQVRAWGLAGREGGLFWAQDFSMEGKSIAEVREAQTVRAGVQFEIEGLAPGAYVIHPFDTWQGTYLDPLQVLCADGDVCSILLPEFKADMAFRVVRK